MNDIYSLFIILTAPCSALVIFLMWSRQAKTGVCVRCLVMGWIDSMKFNDSMGLVLQRVFHRMTSFLPSLRIGRCSGKSLSIWLRSQQTEPRLSQPAFSSNIVAMTLHWKLNLWIYTGRVNSVNILFMLLRGKLARTGGQSTQRKQTRMPC